MTRPSRTLTFEIKSQNQKLCGKNCSKKPFNMLLICKMFSDYITIENQPIGRQDKTTLAGFRIKKNWDEIMDSKLSRLGFCIFST